MVIFCHRTPLSKRQLAFLQTHILKKRKRAQQALGHDSLEDSCKGGPETVHGNFRNRTVDRTQLKSCDDQQTSLDQTDKFDKSKDTEGESVEDVVKQIEVLQSRLESLREEKHQLFKQLKTVLHEEDERKRIKEQKLEMMKGNDMMCNIDPRMAMAGTKRPLPSSPTDVQKKQLKAPLLPTPEQAMYSRQGTGPYRYSAGSESFHSTRPQFTPQTHVASGHRPPFHEHFGQPPIHTQELNMPSSHESHLIPRPQLPPQGYSQQHPVLQDLQNQYPAVPVMGYQYSPSPSHFGSVTGMQSTGQSNQTTILPYQQVPQQGYLQPHPQEILSYQQMQSQPQLQELHMQPQLQLQHDIPTIQGGHPPYIPQGASYADHNNYGHNIQDPRHQKLVIEHQRCSSASGSVTNSPVSLSSNKQDASTSQSESPNQSPAYTQPRDKKHSSKK